MTVEPSALKTYSIADRGITGIVIPADLSQPARSGILHPPHIESLRRLIHGSVASMRLGQERTFAYYRGDARLAHLPYNERATALAWVHQWPMTQVPLINGDAVILGADEDGECSSAPADLVQTLVYAHWFKVQFRISGSPDLWQEDPEIFGTWPDAYRHALRLAMHGLLVEGVRVGSPIW